LCVLLVGALLTGCNGVVASKNYAPVLASDAAAAAPIATSQPAAADARVFIVRAGAALTDDYQNATINVFAWLFDSNKKLLVSTVWYNDIRRMALDSQDAAKRAATYTDANAQIVAQREAKDLIDINNCNLGK